MHYLLGDSIGPNPIMTEAEPPTLWLTDLHFSLMATELERDVSKMGRLSGRLRKTLVYTLCEQVCASIYLANPEGVLLMIGQCESVSKSLLLKELAVHANPAETDNSSV